MSKQYWNGVLSRLPEFCQNMTKIGLTAAMVDQQQRCCRNTSIFPFAYGMMNNMGMGMGMNGADYWNMTGFMPGGCTQIPNMGNMGGYPMGMGGYPMGMGGYPTEMGAYPSMGMNNPILSFDNPSFTEGLRRIGENALNSLGTALGSKNTSNTGDKANAADPNKKNTNLKSEQIKISTIKAGSMAGAYAVGDAIGKTAAKWAIKKCAGKVAASVAGRGIGAAIGSCVPYVGTAVGFIVGWGIGELWDHFVFKGKDDKVTAYKADNMSQEELLAYCNEQKKNIAA